MQNSDAAIAVRTRWLAELAQALDEAQELVNLLPFHDRRYVDTLDVSARLEAARAEVRLLRSSEWQQATGPRPVRQDRGTAECCSPKN